MPSALAYIFLFFILTYSSCTQSSSYGVPVEDPAEILKDHTSFMNYIHRLKLSEDFIALNTSSKIITKGEFLRQALSGTYLPLRLKSNNTVYYQLYEINNSPNEIMWLKYKVDREYKNYQMEGKELPGFDFTDLDGKVYSKKTTSGKIVVLKCWFIGCVPCVEEMPALNKLVNQYKNRKDIVFVSLAFDKKGDLRKFLARKIFNYAVVANQKNYIIKDLEVTSFPTHIVIDKKGKVVKVVGNYEEMRCVLKKLV